MPGLKREAEASIMQKMPLEPATRCAPKPLALELMSDTPMPSPSITHRYVVSPSKLGVATSPARRDRSRPVDPQCVRHRGANRVGSVEEFGRPVVPGLDRRLDEDVRAETVVVELDPVHRCRQQGEVPWLVGGTDQI